MRYEDARDLIHTGDLIGSRDVHGVIGRATVAFTGPYTHTGVALWLPNNRLAMADLNSGRNHLTMVSHLTDFDVCDPPEGMDRSVIELAIWDWLAKPIEYGFAAFVAIGLQESLDLKLFMHWRRIIVCSGGSAQIFEMAAARMRDAGLVPPPGWLEHTRMLSPSALVGELKIKLQVRSQAEQSTAVPALR